MNKKAIYSILSVIVAMMVLSVSLVFAIGPRVSADSETIGYLDQEEYFDIDGAGILQGLTMEGRVYAEQYDKLEVVFPNPRVDTGDWNPPFLGGYTASNGIFFHFPSNGGGKGYERPSLTPIINESWSITSKIVALTFPSSLRRIGDNAFAFLYNLKSVTFCEGLTYIGEGAFDTCENLTTITLPDTVNFIDRFAFESCPLISFPIPKKITSIGEWAFAYSGLTSVVIPNSATFVGEKAFIGCENLTRIYCESETQPTEWHEAWNMTEVPPVGEGVFIDTPFDVVWNCNRTITFDSDGGSATEDQRVCVDHCVLMPENPSKEGYEFKGWYIGDEEYDFATPVTADMTLTAKWEERQIQPEPTEPETPAEENTEVNNQNNNGLRWGIAGTAAGILIIAGIVVGIVIAKRRRK